MSIRTKLILFISTLIIIIGTFSCFFFLIHLKRQQDDALKKLGTSFVMLLAQDDEVKHALSYTQPAFLDSPIKRIKALDTEGEIGYLRISDAQKIIIEEKFSRTNFTIKELPMREDHQNPDVLFTRHIVTSSGEEFFGSMLRKILGFQIGSQYHFE